MIKIDNKNELVMLAPIEEIATKARVIVFNDESIEVENFLAIVKEISEKGTAFDIARITDSIMQRFANITKTIVKAPEKDFAHMIQLLESVEKTEHVMVVELPLKPKRKAILNLGRIKDSMLLLGEAKASSSIFTKEPGQVLTVNDIVITTDPIEFHGSGMFTDKIAILVSKEQYEEIRAYLYKNN